MMLYILNVMVSLEWEISCLIYTIINQSLQFCIDAFLSLKITLFLEFNRIIIVCFKLKRMVS